MENWLYPYYKKRKRYSTIRFAIFCLANLNKSNKSRLAYLVELTLSSLNLLQVMVFVTKPG